MTAKRRKTLYWVFKILAVLVSCIFPVWAICEKFPIWTEVHGTAHSIGVGTILIAIVLLIIFRRTVFDFVKEHFNLKHAPPIAIWFVLLITSYVFIYLGEVMRDLTTVIWMGLIGCGIGTFLTYLSERFGGKEKLNE